MPHKKVIIALLAAVTLFGVTISGCNRNRHPEQRMASAAKGNRQKTKRRAVEDGSVVRPAEVLSASVHRNSPDPRMAQRRRQRQQTQYYRDAQPHQFQQLAAYEPLPEPIPVSELYATQQPQPTGEYAFSGNGYAQPQTYQMQNGPYYASSGNGYAQPQTYQMQNGPYYASSGASPVYNQTSVPAPQYAAAPTTFISEPYTLEPSPTRPAYYEKVYESQPPVQVVHPTPELAMARAKLGGPALLIDQVIAEEPIEVPLPTPESFHVPIPELEPIRYTRSAGNRRPVAAAPAQRRENAYRPVTVPSVNPTTQGWVSSPATAMRY